MNYHIKQSEINTIAILLSISIVFSFDITYVLAQEKESGTSSNMVELQPENNQPSDTTGVVGVTVIKTEVKSDSENTEEINTKDYLPNEIDELNEDNITTKIYKSSDSSLDLIEDNSNLDPAIENDILSKDELLQRSNKNKYYRRTKKADSNLITLPSKRAMLPWLILMSMVVLLGVIFNFLKKKKL